MEVPKTEAIISYNLTITYALLNKRSKGPFQAVLSLVTLHSDSRQGFTFLELLASFAVIAILASLLLPSMNRSRERARRVICANNLKQLAVASASYAESDGEHLFSATADDSDDNQIWAWPLIRSKEVFLCPSAANLVNEMPLMLDQLSGAIGPAGLRNYAGSKTSNGSSYEVFGFMNANGPEEATVHTLSGSLTVKGIRKSEHSVSGYIHKSPAFGLGGVASGPSTIWLFLDGDGDIGMNFPRRSGNHGADGANVQFCDGHVSWIPRQQYVHSYELSQDENRTSP